METGTQKTVTLQLWHVKELQRILNNIAEVYRKGEQYDKRGEILDILSRLD